MLGAMLRTGATELSNYINRIHLQRVQWIPQYAAAITTAIDQYTTTGQVTIFNVERVAKVGGLSNIMRENSETQLGEAVEFWVSEYEAWAMESAIQAAMQTLAESANAESARIMQTAMSDKLHLVTDTVESDWRKDTEQWAADKFAGHEPVYKTMNPIPGFADFLPAFEPGCYYVIAARPAMGKTHIGCNLMTGFEQQTARGVFYTAEMSPVAIARRLFGQNTGINPKGDFTRLNNDKLDLAMSGISGITASQYEIVQMFNIEEICADAYVRYCRGECQYIIIDYLQKLSTTRNYYSDDLRLGHISNMLQRLAKRVDCPVIALAQLSRAVETRGGSKRPQLSDLRGSGNIEQDADFVAFLHRMEYYDILEYEDGTPTENTAEIIIAKNRSDTTGTARTAYNGVRGFFGLNDSKAMFTPTTTPAGYEIQDGETIPF